MRKIWKENIHLRKLDAQSRIVLDLPVGAEIRHVGISRSESYWTHNGGWGNPEEYVTIWYEFYDRPTGNVTPLATKPRELTIVGTDHRVSDALVYRGTKVGDTFAWHVYERP